MHFYGELIAVRHLLNVVSHSRVGRHHIGTCAAAIAAFIAGGGQRIFGTPSAVVELVAIFFVADYGPQAGIVAGRGVVGNLQMVVIIHIGRLRTDVALQLVVQAEAEPGGVGSELAIHKGVGKYNSIVGTCHGNITAGVVQIMVLPCLIVGSVANPIAEGVFAGVYVRYCICIIARS